MKSGSIFVGLVLLATAGCGPAEEEPAAQESASQPAPTRVASQPQWTVLFDGWSAYREEILNGWDIVGEANWTLDANDGSVMADMGGGFLVTESPYADFELTLEFWVDEPANSGVFIRCQDPTSITAANCYEVNIFDTRADQTYRTGAIVGVSPPSEVINAGGQWNTFVIQADGPRLTVTLNDIETVDAEDSNLSTGVIALQYGGGVVKFRNVRIRSL